jgi:hypothetical protein
MRVIGVALDAFLLRKMETRGVVGRLAAEDAQPVSRAIASRPAITTRNFMA